MNRLFAVLAVSLASLGAPSAASAQTPPPPGAPPAAEAVEVKPDGGAAAPPSAKPVTPTDPAASSSKGAETADDPRRKTQGGPRPLDQRRGDNKIRFTADPVGDGAFLAGLIGFVGTLELVLSTGEIRPQQIDPSFNVSSLLAIDRGAVSQHIDPRASTLSNVGLYATIGFAALDPILTRFRDGREAAIVDAFIYAEAGTLAWGVSDIAKVAVRRPRPIAYTNRAAAIAAGTATAATYDNTSTDSALSFFSGHAATVASIGAAATYLAFARSPNTARPWVTLGTSVAMTTFVSIERVRSGAHFPTDVIAGSLAGAAVGLLMVHLHREDTVRQRPVWVGCAPVRGGGTVSLSGAL
jgi:undecaprenyl-diphosphatase